MSDILEKEKEGNIIFIIFGLPMGGTPLKLINYVSYHRVHKMSARHYDKCKFKDIFNHYYKLFCVFVSCDTSLKQRHAGYHDIVRIAFVIFFVF